MVRSRTIWRLMVPILLGAIVACSTPVAESSGLLEGTGRVTFADLGWTEDAVVLADSPASVGFRLPDGSQQGTPVWYGVTLKFRWTGTPSSVGDYALLNGDWNGKAVYQFKAKRLTDLDDGFSWSMADIVNGSSVGYEMSGSMIVSSTNFAQISAVSGGWNEVKLSLSLRNAGNDDVRVLISKESEIVATSWRPTYIEGHADAEVEDNVVDLSVKGRNVGWGASSLSVDALVWSGAHKDVFTWDLGPLAPLGSFELHEKLILESGLEPRRVDVELDWGTGREFYLVWDASAQSSGVSFLGRSVFRSTIGVMVSVVVLWIFVPVLVSSIGKARSR